MAEGQKHILVVDDDTRLRSLLQRYLREQGFLVTSAKDADEAKYIESNYFNNKSLTTIIRNKETAKIMTNQIFIKKPPIKLYL